MFLFRPAFCLASLGLLVALPTAAQNAATPKAAAPTSESATATAYRSAFEGYQSYSDDKLISWKEANDTVGKIGGWRAYAREAGSAQAPAARPGAGAPASSASGPGKP